MLAAAAATVLLCCPTPPGMGMRSFASNSRHATGLHAALGTKVDVYNTPHPRGRVVLLHGLSGSRATYRQQPTRRLVQHLRAQGYQVIVPSLPYDTGVTQAAHLSRVLPQQQGGSYAKAWENRFNHLMHWADDRYGKAPTMVGGISWGGMHALIAAAKNPEVRGYFVHEPVVDPTKLTEFSGLPLANLQMTRYARALNSKPGFISYGGADTRVGSAPARSLITSLRNRQAHLQAIEYPGLDHTTDLQSVNNILRWTRAQRF